MARARIDITGKRFGRLTVIAFSHTEHSSHWKCLCDCGNEKVVEKSNLQKGSVSSCGCLRNDLRAENAAKCARHGHKRAGGKRTKTYSSWEAMRQRCNNPNSKWYYLYGGRGITVDPRWDKFENFLADMGERPENMTLDRKDGTKGYCKDNCRWATKEEQNSNKAPWGTYA